MMGHLELPSQLKLNQYKPRLTFTSRSAHWSASLADLGLPRKGIHGTFFSAGHSCHFTGISVEAEWFR